MKKRLLFVVIIFFASLTAALQAQTDLQYFLPENAKYNPDIPTPADFLGFEVGEFHVTHDRLFSYLKTLDEHSDRVSLQITGYTYERNPLLLMIISSAANHNKLEKIRTDHLTSIDPTANKNFVREKPLIMQLGYSVHGNEPSGVNAAVLVAYYLTACEDDNLKNILDKSVILLDPCLNPDGVNRFASWVNSRKSLNNNPDVNSIEFSEPWPGSRSNHYWYDLNRDWLFLQHPESQARIKAFHQWKPQVLTDHHEMGSHSTFFFQPGVKSRNNPIIPESNYILTQKIGTYHARALDEIGSLYWTEDSFDDFYVGKGATYPDLNGGIGILFEQASSRGHERITPYGKLSFAFTIRNQVKVSLSTVHAAWNMRKELQYHQENFYKEALDAAAKNPVKGYVFGSTSDPQRTAMMIDALLQHQIQVLELTKDTEINDELFNAGSSYFIPSVQPQFRMIQALMDKQTQFADSTFYDISAWGLPLAMGISCEEVSAKDLAKIKTGNQLDKTPVTKGQLLNGIAAQAYLFEWTPYLAPKALFSLLNAGLVVKVSNSPFSMLNDAGDRQSFDYGTIMIPVQQQPMNGQQLHSFLQNLAGENGLIIHPVQSAYTVSGPDLGSGSLSFIKLPKVLMLTGSGLSSSEAGQIWHLFDTRFHIPVTMAEMSRLASLDLSSYNTLILVSGSYANLGDVELENLKSWIRNGGKVIALKTANNFLKSAGIIHFDNKPAGAYPETESKFRPFVDRRTDRIGRSVPGSIFEARIDRSHPLGYGYTTDHIAVFKNTASFIAPSGNPYNNPLYYTENPLLSGYINEQNLEGLSESVVVQSYSFGQGRIVSFFDDPFYRGWFAGEHKLFFNALYFDF